MKRDLQAVMRVKERHEDALLGVDGVQGVGVGLRAGEPAITVFLEPGDGPDEPEIPERLDDVPVIVESPGAFEAH